MFRALNDLGMTNGMITSAIITIILCVVGIIAGRRVQMIPSGFQVFVEWSIGTLYHFFEGIMGKACRTYFPLIGTLFIYILLCNYSGLLPAAGEVPGLASPTSSINCTLAMALIVFVTIQIAGIRSHHGLKYYKHWIEPIVFICPLMIIEDLVKPVSLTIRLYGNIYGEETVVSSFFNLVPIGLPCIMQALSVLMGLIQALVFSLLAAIYISEAMPEEHELM